MFPALSAIAASFKVLPPHTADCERDFSKLKLVKSVLRNRMGENTLDALLRISIAGPSLENFSFEKAAERWSSVKNRRLKRKINKIVVSQRMHQWISFAFKIKTVDNKPEHVLAIYSFFLILIELYII